MAIIDIDWSYTASGRFNAEDVKETMLVRFGIACSWALGKLERTRRWDS
jgi:hypothetical protein